MADRENVKIVISAALIVIVSSMGIYAFIYRDKISRLLPSWQSKEKNERIISDESINPPISQPDSNLETEKESENLTLNQDQDTKDYPVIPNLDDSTQNSKKNTDNSGYIPPGIQDEPKTSIEPSKEKKSQEIENPSKKTNSGTVYKAPIEKKAPVVKKKSLTKKPKTAVSKSKPKKTSVPNKTAKKKYTKQSKPTSSYTKNSSKKQTTVSQKSSQNKKVSTSIETRIQRLEEKLNVHVQDTNSRLNSLERRVERLEKKLTNNSK